MAEGIEYSGEERFESHVVRIEVDDDEFIYRTIKVPVGDYTTQEEIEEYIDEMLADWESLYENEPH